MWPLRSPHCVWLSALPSGCDLLGATRHCDLGCPTDHELGQLCERHHMHSLRLGIALCRVAERVQADVGGLMRACGVLRRHQFTQALNALVHRLQRLQLTKVVCPALVT